jgi:hypothetical protein
VVIFRPLVPASFVIPQLPQALQLRCRLVGLEPAAPDLDTWTSPIEHSLHALSPAGPLPIRYALHTAGSLTARRWS